MSVIVIFLIGVIIGIFVTFKIPQNDKADIEEYVQNSINLLKENSIDRQNVFKETLINNLKFLGIVWILGCTVIASFTIYILMIYKGFLLGYIISIVVSIFRNTARTEFFISNTYIAKYNFSTNSFFTSY